MLRSLIDPCIRLVNKVANIGITPDLSFHEKKKSQLLNIAIASCLPITFIFTFVNFFHQKPLLAIINICIFIGEILILIINSYRKFLLGRLILTFLASAMFTISAILFRNGSEYFLIANLIVIIIYFNDKKYLIAISLFNCSLFIGIKIFLETDIVYDTVSFGRVVFNIVWTLSIMILALLFFKHEQVAYQELIEEKNRDLQSLNDTKEKLFSIISHDLRSPIGQLKSSLDLVSSEDLSPESFQKISAKLSSEVGRLHATLDNLLVWSISQLKGIKAAPVKVNLASILQQKMEIYEQMIEQKKLRVVMDDLDRNVWVDPNHLKVVIRNLISNAIKYSFENGYILIRSSVKDQMVVIEVIDTGVGMSKETQQIIFQMDHLISNTGTANEKGTGIGLKLCKEFIEKNNGEIWVKSSEKKGSTFFISLPEAK